MFTESEPQVVAVTGANGRVGERIVTEIINGHLLDENVPIHLRLLEHPSAIGQLEANAMDWTDIPSSVQNITTTANPEEAFDGAHVVIMAGALPRKDGMERSDLLLINAPIFAEQGQALNARANDKVRVLVVGNPANTNALIASANAPDIPKRSFSAMMMLDHNRTLTELARQLGVPPEQLRHLFVWGNHSPTVTPDIRFTTTGGKSVLDSLPANYVSDTLAPFVRDRGKKIINASPTRMSSGPSAANAAVSAMRNWLAETEGDWVSMAVHSDGAYGIAEDIFFSFPCVSRSGEYTIVDGLNVDSWTRQEIDKSAGELQKEREVIFEYLPK